MRVVRLLLLGVGLLVPLACGGSPAATTAPATALATAPATAPATATMAAAPDAARIVAALKAAGVPVGEVKVYTAADDPNSLLGRPGQYTGKAAFTLTSIPADKQDTADPFSVENGGSVEVFAGADDAATRARYVAAVTKSMPMFAEYDTLHGTVLLRLSHLLTPDQAAAYQRALASVLH